VAMLQPAFGPHVAAAFDIFHFIIPDGHLGRAMTPGMPR
jgi:hypothetical protein